MKYFHPGKTVTVLGKEFPVISEAEREKLPADFSLLCGIIDYSVMEELKAKFSGVKVEYLDYYSSMPPEFILKNEAVLTDIAGHLGDAESMTVLENFLLARTTGDIACVEKMVHGKEGGYDWELLRLNPSDVVVDGGAYRGDTIEEIEGFVGGPVKKVYAFEPDPESYAILTEKFSGRSDIVCINAGLYDTEGFVSFTGDGTMSSAVSEGGGTKIRVKALDLSFSDVTLIEMDIEGSEPKALAGTRELIEKNVPNLAIRIYHKDSDLIEIWGFMKKLTVFSSYRYYLRHHSRSVDETTLYAIRG